ncbi:MAG: hypothetical protein AB1714_17920 [Acidobacteriota bacterium]
MTRRDMLWRMACALLGMRAYANPPAPDESLAAAFLQEMAERSRGATGSVVAGKNGYLFFVPELRHLGVGQFWGDAALRVSRAPDPNDADPLPAILDFQTQLARAGIELLFVPVPAKAIVYPDMISDRVKIAGDRAPRLDICHQAFYRLLGERGVHVLDLTGEFLERRRNTQGSLYCQQDTHWSGLACSVAAEAIAARILQKAGPIAPSIARRYTTKPLVVEITGDLWRDLAEPRPPREKLQVLQVGLATPDGWVPVESWRQSPVLLLGDSHDLVFHGGDDMHAQSAGLADHLALHLGFPADLLAVRGSGATPSRVNLLRRADNLAGKRVVIWCMSVREFTEGSGWKKVPVVR